MAFQYENEERKEKMRTRFVSNTRLMLCVDPISEKAGPEDIRKETDPDANFLLVTKGGVLDLDVADRFGLINSEYDADAVTEPAEPKRKGKAKAKEPSKEGVAEEDADDKSEGAGGDGAEPLA